jgi:hypothetical protein
LPEWRLPFITADPTAACAKAASRSHGTFDSATGDSDVTQLSLYCQFLEDRLVPSCQPTASGVCEGTDCRPAEELFGQGTDFGMRHQTPRLDSAL